MSGKIIKELWAYVTVDEDGNESIPAFQGNDDVMYPLVGADMERMDSLLFKKFAQAVADIRGSEVKLIKVSNVEVINIIKPSIKG